MQQISKQKVTFQSSQYSLLLCFLYSEVNLDLQEILLEIGFIEKMRATWVNK